MFPAPTDAESQVYPLLAGVVSEVNQYLKVMSVRAIVVAPRLNIFVWGFMFWVGLAVVPVWYWAFKFAPLFTVILTAVEVVTAPSLSVALAVKL
jgi:hypothetical protein